jgi:hypothetical protein
MTPEERQKRMQERLAAMSPDERAAFEARRAQGGFGRGEGGANRGQNGGRGGGNGQQNAAARSGSRGMVASTVAGTAVSSGSSTIDSLFAPIQIVEAPGRLWLYDNKQLKSVRVRTGVTDGTFTELVDAGQLAENTEVVINMVTGLEPRNTPGQGAGNPLMGPQRGGPGGPGGNRGGGGGRGF